MRGELGGGGESRDVEDRHAEGEDVRGRRRRWEAGAGGSGLGERWDEQQGGYVLADRWDEQQGAWVSGCRRQRIFYIYIYIITGVGRGVEERAAHQRRRRGLERAHGQVKVAQRGGCVRPGPCQGTIP